MAQLSHAKPGVVAVSGSFLGSSATTIRAGAGSFTVARSGSTTSTIYTITLQGPVPKADKIVCVASIEDGSLTGASDAFLLNVKSVTPSTGTIVLQARDVAGTAGPADDAAVIHFVAFLHVATDSVA
jgi:hypothetical protein